LELLKTPAIKLSGSCSKRDVKNSRRVAKNYKTVPNTLIDVLIEPNMIDYTSKTFLATFLEFLATILEFLATLLGSC